MSIFQRRRVCGSVRYTDKSERNSDALSRRALQKQQTSYLRVNLRVEAAKRTGLKYFLFPELPGKRAASEESSGSQTTEKDATLANLVNEASSNCSVLKSACSTTSERVVIGSLKRKK